MAEHADGSIIIDTEIDPGGFTTGIDGIKRAAKSLKVKMDTVESTIQKAISSDTRAMSGFNLQIETVEKTTSQLEQKLSDLGNKRIPTEDYEWVTSEIQKAESALDKLTARQNKMQATGVKENSKACQSLQYDIDLARNKLNDLLATKEILENSGQAFTMGSDTVQYQQLLADLEAARQRLANAVNLKDTPGILRIFHR